MFVLNGWACWEVMECSRGNSCPARKFPARKCWEIVGELGCHPCAPDVCSDCIVYVLQNEKDLFSEEDLRALAQRKVTCTCFLSWL